MGLFCIDAEGGLAERKGTFYEALLGTNWRVVYHVPDFQAMVMA
jgi:hypothetical protein